MTTKIKFEYSEVCCICKKKKDEDDLLCTGTINEKGEEEVICLDCEDRNPYYSNL